MSIYICPFCKMETEDGIDNLIEHRKPNGDCETRMTERMEQGE